MSSTGYTQTSDRNAPAPLRGPARWLASEWGLAILALVLAVLVWAVVWDRIADESPPLMVKLDLRTSPGFVAFHEGEVPLVLNGPRSEVEEAIVKLGTPYEVLVNVPDIEKGDRKSIWIRDTSLLSLPFPDRLVASLGEANVEVYKIREVQVRFLDPTVRGLPPGVGYTVRVEPDSMPIRGPGGKLSATIAPDAVDLSDLFADHESGLLPPKRSRQLGFGDWRSDPEEARYRQSVELPQVHATFEFSYQGTREIRNRIEFKLAKGYVVKPTDNPEVEQGYYTGAFEGAEEDLDRLQENLDAWWYVVTVPRERLPAGDDELDEDLKIEFAHKQSIGGLRVRFREGASQMVVIKRAP